MGNMYKHGKLFNCCEQFFRHEKIDKHISPEQKSLFMKIASTFGQGVSHRGSICGAVSSAAMLLGYKYGTDGTEPSKLFYEKREKLENSMRTLITNFEEAFGSVNCQELIRFSVWDVKNREKFLKLLVSGKLNCTDYINFTAKIVDDLLTK